MSHAYHDRESNIVFNFDGGLTSGELVMNVPSHCVTVQANYRQVTIPVEAILRLVAWHHVAPKRIAAIESLDPLDLLA